MVEFTTTCRHPLAPRMNFLPIRCLVLSLTAWGCVFRRYWFRRGFRRAQSSSAIAFLIMPQSRRALPRSLSAPSITSPREKNADTFLDLLSLGAPRKEPDVLQGVSNPHAAAFFPDAAARLAGAAAARNVPGTLVGDIQAVADIHAAAPAVARSQHFRPLPMDSLLRDNVIHFHAAEMHLPFAQQTHFDLSYIMTEADTLV